MSGSTYLACSAAAATGEQLGPAFAVDDPVDQVGTEAPLEGDHRLLRVGHVIAEPLQREQEAGVGPVGVDQIARRARQREPALGQLPPREQLARILLARRGDVGMADDVAAADAVPLLDVGDQRDDRARSARREIRDSRIRGRD